MPSFDLTTNDRGVAAVEFAMIAPVLILMICGFMEYAHLSSARTTLEAATMRAARAVAATDCPSSREAIMRSIIESSMDNVPSADGGKPKIVTKAYGDKFGDVGGEPFVDKNKNKVYDEDPTITDPDKRDTYTDINGNGKYDKDMGNVGSIGAAGQVISYSAEYKVKSLFGFISKRYSDADFYTIKASTVVRNEPVFRAGGCAS